MRPIITTNRGTIPAIVTRQNFANAGGTVRGSHWGDFHPGDLGELPTVTAEQFMDSVTDARYVVWSYGTPIAWIDDSNVRGWAVWHIPDIFYSVTTSKHRRLVLDAYKKEQAQQEKLGKTVSYLTR